MLWFRFAIVATACSALTGCGQAVDENVIEDAIAAKGNLPHKCVHLSSVSAHDHRVLHNMKENPDAWIREDLADGKFGVMGDDDRQLSPDQREFQNAVMNAFTELGLAQGVFFVQFGRIVNVTSPVTFIKPDGRSLLSDDTPQYGEEEGYKVCVAQLEVEKVKNWTQEAGEAGDYAIVDFKLSPDPKFKGAEALQDYIKRAGESNERITNYKVLFRRMNNGISITNLPSKNDI